MQASGAQLLSTVQNSRNTLRTLCRCIAGSRAPRTTLPVYAGAEVWITATATSHIAGQMGWSTPKQLVSPRIFTIFFYSGEVCYGIVLWFHWRQVVDLRSSSPWRDFAGLDEGFLADMSPHEGIYAFRSATCWSLWRG